MQNSTASLVFHSLRRHASRRQYALVSGSRHGPLQLHQQPQGDRRRVFHSSRCVNAVKPFILADIGEGITEVQIIQWFVQPGARVEQFDKLCEVQSDKASVEITSRFDGVIKKLHYEQDDTAKVGKALCDIDIEGEIDEKDAALVTPAEGQAGTPDTAQKPQEATQQASQPSNEQDQGKRTSEFRPDPPSERRNGTSNGHVSSLATPAVRGLLKELGVSIGEVLGTGRDGRVLKEDVHNFVAARTSQQTREQPSGASRQSADKAEMPSTAPPQPKPWIASTDGSKQTETVVPLTPVQSVMFKAMTRSLSIPHFMYGDEVDLTALSSLRSRLNAGAATRHDKLSFLPFIIKAVSLALNDYPILNARIEQPSSEPSTSSTSPSPPKLIHRSQHNIGVAMDTPQGLLVPNIKDVASLSVRDIAAHLSWLQHLASRGKLSAADLAGGTVTVSNIGSIGGTYVAPVVSASEVAILGVGRARVVPAFADEDEGKGGQGELKLVKKTVANFSWSADHRVVDGATVARAGERVRRLLERPEVMLAELR